MSIERLNNVLNLPFELLLRKFENEDIDQIVELEKRAFPVGPYPRSLLKRILKSTKSFNYVLEVDGRIIGYVVAIPLDEYSADVESIAIDPNFQRSGYGGLMMNAIEDEMKKRGFAYSVLEVRDENYESIAFYKRHGYEEIEYLPNYYHEKFRGSRGAYRMRKALN